MSGSQHNNGGNASNMSTNMPRELGGGTKATSGDAVPFRDFLKIIKQEHDNVRDLRERFEKAYQQKDHDEMNAIVNTTVRIASLHSDSEEVR